MLASDELVHDASERRRLHESSGADAVDMESGVLAASGRLAGVLRAITDVPASAIEGVDSTVHADGRTDVAGLVRWVVAKRGRAIRSMQGRARGAARARRGARMSMNGGRVLLAAPRSFCAGVDRAIEIVERLLEQHGPPVYVRHQIVHNEHVVRRLEGLGAVFVEDESEIPAGEFCVLSAHGVAPSVKANAQARGLRIVDATCPLVNKVHAEARRYADSGHLVALVGHANHVEVIGTLGERPGSTIVIESPEQARELQTDKPVAVITQTTLSLDDVAPIVDALEEHLGELRRPHADDICYATQNRQDAVKAMVAEGATLILVIGSETSSNAKRLVEVAEAAGAVATLVDGESPLDEELLAGHEHRRPHRGRVDAGGARARHRRAARPARLRHARGDHGRPRARPLPAAEGGGARMTGLRPPVTSRTGFASSANSSAVAAVGARDDEHRSSVLDRGRAPDAVGDGHHERGLAERRPLRPPRRDRVRPRDARALARPRAGARDGFLRGSRGACWNGSCPSDSQTRERLVVALLGPRAEQVPFADGRLCIGQWQRILLFSLDTEHRHDWTLTLLG